MAAGQQQDIGPTKLITKKPLSEQLAIQLEQSMRTELKKNEAMIERNPKKFG